MSIANWKKEFFHTPMPLTRIAAIKHSIRKWEGLKEVNRRKHGLTLSKHYPDMITDDDASIGMYIDGTNCALCELFDLCSGCPVNTVTGTNCEMQWGAWVAKQATGPMLKVLHKALAAEMRKKVNGKPKTE